MTLEKARELLQVQIGFGGGYNRHGANLILKAVIHEHGQTAANGLIRELRLDEIFGFAQRSGPGDR
jgi:hypothetical protein